MNFLSKEQPWIVKLLKESRIGGFLQLSGIAKGRVLPGCLVNAEDGRSPTCRFALCHTDTDTDTHQFRRNLMFQNRQCATRGISASIIPSCQILKPHWFRIFRVAVTEREKGSRDLREFHLNHNTASSQKTLSVALVLNLRPRLISELPWLSKAVVKRDAPCFTPFFAVVAKRITAMKGMMWFLNDSSFPF